ncbi:mariner transposase [Trichonephila clavipes]|nr:mariner transposase [Trichonephila clavipes]
MVELRARKKLTDVYGEGLLTVRQCQNWFAKFQSGNFDVEDAPRSGRPVEADKDAIKALVDANRHIDVCDSLLKRHENDPFLKRIITGDENGHGAKKMNRLKPFPKPIFTKKRGQPYFRISDSFTRSWSSPVLPPPLQGFSGNNSNPIPPWLTAPAGFDDSPYEPRRYIFPGA